MTQLIERLSQLVGFTPAVVERLVATILAVVALLVVRLIVVTLVRRYVHDVASQYRLRRMSSYVITFLGLAVVARLWIPGMGSVATFIGLVGAGLAVAMRDTISNLTGWLFIVSRRPFAVGDRIEVGGTAGDVIDIRLFQFSVLEIQNWVQADQSTGRIVHIPNGNVLREHLANYTRGFAYLWNELEVRITFESNWRKAKRIIEEIVKHEDVSQEASRQIRRAADDYLIYFTNLTPIVYTAVRETGVVLTARYLTPVRQRRGREHRIWEAILDAFAREDDINYAYPTIRTFDNAREGKVDARGPSRHG